MSKGDSLFDLTIKRYDLEVERRHHLDNKAISQIGFSGVIIAILGFVFGSLEFQEIITNGYLWTLALGMGFLLISIGFGMIGIIAKKNLAVFLPEKFFDKFKTLEEAEQREKILLAYFDMIADLELVNNSKAWLLNISSIVMITGLVISFISFLLIFKLIGN